MTTGATLFSGGELVGVGMRQAGIRHLWGIEIDDAIASVARMNGFDVTTADVLAIDPASLPVPDVLHVSPECQRASTANNAGELNEDGTRETPLDVAFGEKIAQFIDAMKPKIFTLENVYPYRKFKAFNIILAALARNGYMYDYDNLNAADFGVPQTRRRLILRAVRGALLPILPAPEGWVGWYEAIEDLIPALPESRFAKWQLERLPGEIIESVLLNRNQSERDDYYRSTDYPAYTVCADGDSGRRRAFIVDQNYGSPNDNGKERILSIKADSEPVFTIGAGNGDKREIRAWLVPGQNSKGNGFPIRAGVEPSFVVTDQGKGLARAYLVSSIDSTVRDGNEPASTVVAVGDGHSVSPRAWLSQGRIIKMTPRALARFQSVPDSYILPEKAALACKVIGNGVPCLLYQKVIEQLVEVTK